METNQTKEWKRVSISITPEAHVLLKKHAYGNSSRLIEFLIRTYDQGRMLTKEEVIKGKLDEEEEEEENLKAA